MDALCGIRWNPAISIEKNKGHEQDTLILKSLWYDFGLPWDADMITPRVSIGSWFFSWSPPNDLATNDGCWR